MIHTGSVVRVCDKENFHLLICLNPLMDICRDGEQISGDYPVRSAVKIENALPSEYIPGLVSFYIVICNHVPCRDSCECKVKRERKWLNKRAE